MKKIIATILLLILALSLAACGGGNSGGGSSTAPADSTPSGGSSTAPADSAPSGGSSTAPADSAPSVGSGSSAATAPPAPLIGWMSEGKYSFDFTMTMESAEGSMESAGSMASDGGKSAMTVEMSIIGMTIKQKIIVKDGKTYLLDDGNKSYMEMPIGEAADSITDFSNLTLIGAGTGEIKGRTLPYEDYKQGGSGETVRYYLDGGQVYGIETSSTGSKTTMIITNPKNSVPAGVFDIPADYRAAAGISGLGGINLEDYLPEGFDMSDLELPEGFEMPALPDGVKIPGM